MIKFGRELGFTGSNSARSFILRPCSVCGEEYWVRCVKGKPASTRCRSCLPRLRYKNYQGYVCVRLDANDPYFPLTRARGIVFEHRLVMAKHLGRLLHSWEVVHHKNGIRDDNRIENLELLPNQTEHLLNKSLVQRIEELERENKELREKLNADICLQV